MDIVYAGEEAPHTYRKSIFLVGPTPRDKETPSWRPAMIQALEEAGYDGVVFYPERREGAAYDYLNQVEWEKQHLEMADLILAWVPRSERMPAFTTNVEFGKYVGSGKLFYGRPDGAQKTGYLDWLYRDQTKNEPCVTMDSIAKLSNSVMGEGALRFMGERYVPLLIWKTPMFQQWYNSQIAVGNSLEYARVLWSFAIPKLRSIFCYALKVKMWIGAEQRYKENEFVLSRTNISCILPFYRPTGTSDLDSKIVLVREFRAPVNNEKCMVCELPGGSSFQIEEDPCTVAAHELEEETGLRIPAERFRLLDDRQVMATFASQHAILFGVQLTEEEIRQAEIVAATGQSFGVKSDTEKTYVAVRTLREILWTDEVDWSMIGMIAGGLAGYEANPQDRSGVGTGY